MITCNIMYDKKETFREIRRYDVYLLQFNMTLKELLGSASFHTIFKSKLEKRK